MYHHLAQHAFGLVVGGLHAGIAYKREQVSLLPMYISISFILFITSLRIVSDGSEDAVTSQRARHGNAAARIAPFRIKCAKHSFTEGPIHRLDYDKDVFTCIVLVIKFRLFSVIHRHGLGLKVCETFCPVLCIQTNLLLNNFPAPIYPISVNFIKLT